MSSENDELILVYKFGKSIRGIGTSLLWSNVYCLLILAVLIVLSMNFSFLVYITIGPLAAIVVFQIQNIIYKIKMTRQGFNIASTTGIKSYTIFSFLYILSYIIIMTMYGILTYLILFKGVNIVSFFSNPTNDLFNTLYQYVINAGFILYAPIIILFGGYALRIISWFYFKDGIKKTIYQEIVEVISSKCIQMIIWLIILAIFSLIFFFSFRSINHISFTSYGGIVEYQDFTLTLLTSLAMLCFYVLEVSVYRSIGRMMKSVYNQPDSSERLYQYSQHSMNKNPNYNGNLNHKIYPDPQKEKTSSPIPNNGFIYCPECGSANSINDINCQSCGKPLKK